MYPYIFGIKTLFVNGNPMESTCSLAVICKCSVGNIVADGDPLENIVTLYVTLNQGLSPVLDAEVYATVEGGQNAVTVNFLDNGQGA